jgi:hypothetical protein
VLVVVVVAGLVVGASVFFGSLHTEAETDSPSTDGLGAPTTRDAESAGSELRPEQVAALHTGVEDGDPRELYRVLAEPVHIAIAASDFDDDRTRDQAVTDLEYLRAEGEWEWDLDAETLEAFRAGPYEERFPEDAVVGRSADGYVVSFDPDGDRVVGVFVSRSVSLLVAGT